MSQFERPTPAPTGASYRDVVVAVTMKRYQELLVPGVFDAVVSSDDTMLTMGGGVGEALARLGGPGYVAAVASHRPAHVGDVVATSAGALPVRHVLHAVTLDWSAAARPTPRTVRELAREIFARCESLEVESVLVPLVAAGIGNFAPLASATTLADVLFQHLLNPSVLLHVTISVPDGRVFDACRELLPRRLAEFECRRRIELKFTREPGVPLAARRGTVTSVDDRSGDTALTAPLGKPRDAASADSARLRELLDEPPGAAGPVMPATRRRESPREGLWKWLFPRRTSPGHVTHAPDRTSIAPTARRAAGGTPDAESPSRSPTLFEGRFANQRLAPAPALEHSRQVLARRYVLLEELGRGGFGIVHLSWDLVLRRVVAIKQLRTDRSLSEILRREAAIALELSHESIVRTHHFEPEAGSAGAFIVMEYVPWPTAERWLANGGDQLPPPRVVAELGTHVCDALEYAHARQVLHLDLKPANLFVDVAAEQVKLADFGLARVSSSAGRVLPEVLSGTPAYMAPEQLTPGVRLTSATDLYQLAATLWDLLVGEAPRPGPDVPQGTEPARQRVLEAIRPALSATVESRPANATRFRELLASAI